MRLLAEIPHCRPQTVCHFGLFLYPVSHHNLDIISHTFYATSFQLAKVTLNEMKHKLGQMVFMDSHTWCDNSNLNDFPKNMGENLSEVAISGHSKRISQMILTLGLAEID